MLVQKQVHSEVGALRGVPARKGSEQRSASEGKAGPSKNKTLKCQIMS